jgi:hypothetical protein
MIKFIILLFITLSALASPKEDAQVLLNRFAAFHPTETRIDFISQGFVGLPYGKGGPLGEGPDGRYDQDPLYRFDTFDCTTFVETVISLALTHNVDAFETKMNEIRYENSNVDYLKRNHFPSLQWIPNNIQNGIFKEVNSLVLPQAERKIVESVINLAGWLKAIKLDEIKTPYATLEERQSLLEELQSYANQYSTMDVQLEYLPISTLLKKPKVLSRIPHGSVINFIRPNWDLNDSIGTHMNVSHQGFVIQKKSGTYLRHASTTGAVMENALIDYLKKFENHPTLKGIHLLQLN